MNDIANLLYVLFYFFVKIFISYKNSAYIFDVFIPSAIAACDMLGYVSPVLIILTRRIGIFIRGAFCFGFGISIPSVSASSNLLYFK